MKLEKEAKQMGLPFWYYHRTSAKTKKNADKQLKEFLKHNNPKNRNIEIEEVKKRKVVSYVFEYKLKVNKL